MSPIQLPLKIFLIIHTYLYQFLLYNSILLQVRKKFLLKLFDSSCFFAYLSMIFAVLLQQDIYLGLFQTPCLKEIRIPLSERTEKI